MSRATGARPSATVKSDGRQASTHEAKPLYDDKGFIVERRGQSRRERRQHLVVPEALVLGAPLGNARKPFALVDRQAQISIAEPDDLCTEKLDDAHGRPAGVHDGRQLAGLRERLAVVLPLDQQR